MRETHYINIDIRSKDVDLLNAFYATVNGLCIMCSRISLPDLEPGQSYTMQVGETDDEGYDPIEFETVVKGSKDDAQKLHHQISKMVKAVNEEMAMYCGDEVPMRIELLPLDARKSKVFSSERDFYAESSRRMGKEIEADDEDIVGELDPKVQALLKQLLG